MRKRLRWPKDTGSATTYRVACEAWLLAERGIHMGDAVKLHYGSATKDYDDALAPADCPAQRKWPSEVEDIFARASRRTL